jgi:hypothetical protein
MNSPAVVLNLFQEVSLILKKIGTIAQGLLPNWLLAKTIQKLII